MRCSISRELIVIQVFQLSCIAPASIILVIQFEDRKIKNQMSYHLSLCIEHSQTCHIIGYIYSYTIYTQLVCVLHFTREVR